MKPKQHDLAIHISDEELDDLLIGVGSAEAEAHLAGCAPCTARRAEFVAALAGFNQATLAWSEAKSNTLTRDLTASQGAVAPRLGLAAAGLCGAAVVAVLLSTGVPGPHWRGTGPGSVRGQAAAMDRDGEIAGDNAMLQEIDAALYRPDPSPEQTYRLQEARGHTGRPAGESTVWE